jgi:UDP-2,4-diacetamido-2,4,6-trideoxy-beta-L-altropyranose hydrolase
VHFISRAHPGNILKMVAEEGFRVTLLPPPANREGRSESYSDWLGVPQEQDAAQTIAGLQRDRLDWLVVDHYGLDAEWEKLLRPYSRKIMVIDDLANRSHNADVLLDQNYSTTGVARYLNLVPRECVTLAGPRFALLRPEYRDYRFAASRPARPVTRVLAFMGGSDHLDVTGKVLEAFCTPKLEDVRLDIVVGSNYHFEEKLQRRAAQRPQTHLYSQRPHLADLMAAADMAVGAGGATTWERMCLGLPSVVISIAENQRPSCEALAQDELIVYLGPATDVDVPRLTTTVLEMVQEPERLRAHGRSIQALVDGHGVKRVVEVLRPSSDRELYVRAAHTADRLAGSGVSTESSGSEGSAFILESRGLAMGRICFDPQGSDEFAVSYWLEDFVDAGRRNELLRRGIQSFNETRPRTLNEGSTHEFDVPSPPFLRRAETTAQDERDRFSIAILSDRESWINRWLPRLVDLWIEDGHRVLWTHTLKGLPPGDFCFYLSFSQIVPRHVRETFRHNLVVHESDLPFGKGWSPLTWQILEGRNNIPVTLIEAADKVDSGVVYAQHWLEFQGHELIDELRSAQAGATIELCRTFVGSYPESAGNARVQSGEESFFVRRTPEDSRLDPTMTLGEQFNLLRVVDNASYPAFFEMLEKTYKLEVTKVTNEIRD